MNRKLKGVVHLFLIIVVVIIGIGGLLYFSWQKGIIKTGSPPTSSPVYSSQEDCEQKTGMTCAFQNCDYTTKDKSIEEVCGKDFKKGWVPTENDIQQHEFANWKTYTNKEFNFNLKYPKEIYNLELDTFPEFSKRNNTENIRKDFTEFMYYDPPNEKFGFYLKDKKTATLILELWIFSNPDTLSIDTWYEKYKYYPHYFGDATQETVNQERPKNDILLNGITGKYAIVSLMGNHKFVYLKRDNLIYLMNLAIDSDGKNNTEILDQILSTSKFIEVSENNVDIKFKEGVKFETPENLIPQKLRDSITNIKPLFTLSEAETDKLNAKNLKLWYRVELKKDIDPDNFIDELKLSSNIEIVELAPLPQPLP